MSTHTPPPPEPSRFFVEPFGKYVLVQKLAEGGMAEIFLAKQTGIAGLERHVVIKRMLPHISRQKRFVDMFLDEAKVAARLVHPNVIPIYEVGRVEDSYYIAMEYLPGEDLAWLLSEAHERRQMLPIEVALRIIMLAARGLHHAHELEDDHGRALNIVHRDVSPSNLYVSYDGQVKVLDFGIAKAESRLTSTRTGTVKGKTHYMAPEQGRAAPVDRRADVYALGVTLYEALTVWPPFARETVQETIDAVGRNEYRPPRTRRPEIPQLVERACMKAMSADARDRQPSCAELAAELESALESPLPNGADPLIGAFIREFSGEALVAKKSRIPPLSALQQDATDRIRRVRRQSLWTRVHRMSARLTPGIALATVLFGALVIATIAWRAHERVVPPPGCSARYGAADGDAITIGATLPLTVDGKWASDQAELLDAFRLGLDEVNQRDGVAGRRFALIVCGNGSDVAIMKQQVKWLSEEQHITALITSWSSLTMAAVNVALPRGVPVISADATSPELSAQPAVGEGGVRMLWRTAPSDATQAELAAQLIAHDPSFAGVKRVGILYQDDPYGQGWAAAFTAQLPKSAPGVEAHAIQFPQRGDVRSAVAQLATWLPDVTVLVCFPFDATRVLNAAAEHRTLTRAGGNRWLFTEMIEPSLFDGLAHPAEIDGAYDLESADGGGVEAASYAARFRARFGREASEQTYSSNRYDAMYLIALGAAWAAGSDGKGRIDGARVAAGMTHLSSGPRVSLTPESFTAAKATLQAGGNIDVVGASGALDFDAATGDARAGFQLWRVRGKGFVKDRRIGF